VHNDKVTKHVHWSKMWQLFGLFLTTFQQLDLISWLHACRVWIFRDFPGSVVHTLLTVLHSFILFHKQTSHHDRSTDPFIVCFTPDVDTVAKVLDLDEHDLVVVVPPVIGDVNRWVITHLTCKVDRLIHHDDLITWRQFHYICRCICNRHNHSWKLTDLQRSVVAW